MKQLHVHTNVLTDVIKLIEVEVPFDPSWVVEDRLEPELEPHQIAEGQLVYAIDKENGDRVVIIGRLHDNIQCLYEVDRRTGRTTSFERWTSFQFAGSNDLMEFIETDGYVKSIETLKLYFALFERDHELTELFERVIAAGSPQECWAMCLPEGVDNVENPAMLIREELVSELCVDGKTSGVICTPWDGDTDLDAMTWTGSSDIPVGVDYVNEAYKTPQGQGLDLDAAPVPQIEPATFKVSVEDESESGKEEDATVQSGKAYSPLPETQRVSRLRRLAKPAVLVGASAVVLLCGLALLASRP